MRETAKPPEASEARVESWTGVWSDEARAMARPIRTYRALAAEPPGTPREERLRLAAKVLFTLLAVAAFVSISVAGRLVAVHLVFTVVFWSFAPMLQIAGVAAATRIFAPGQPIVRAARLYFVGGGPWLVFFLFVAGVCLFAADVYATMMRLLTIGVLPALFVITFAWGIFLTFAFFRHGLAIARGRAILATLVFYLVYGGAIFAYFFFTDQIRPQFFWTGT